MPSPRYAAIGQSKRPRSINDMESEQGLLRQQQQLTANAAEDTRIRVQIPQRESRAGSGSGNSREQYQQDDSPVMTHPGELVICKKKRKDREKSGVKPRTGSGGPVSPAVARPVGVITPKQAQPAAAAHQQAWSSPTGHPVNGGSGSVGWANPVKRLRTDVGKRRPSHL